VSAPLPLLTASRLKDFRRCPRLHHYRYKLGIRPIESATELRFGTLVHLGLQRWWEARLPEPARAEAAARIESAEVRELVLAGDEIGAALAAVAGAAADPFEQARLEEMLRGYNLRWYDSDLVPIAVEVQFTAPLVNPITGKASVTYQLAGKLDVIARDSRGRTVIVEHKTSSEDITAGSKYWLRLRMDGQITQYFTGARALGFEPAACFYDVLYKPKLEPLEATTPDKREVTLPKYRACPECKRRGAPPPPHQVSIECSVPGATIDCGQAAIFPLGDGNQVDVPGVPGKVISEPPRYKAFVRLADETPYEHRLRIIDAIASEREKYFARGEVVRLEADEREHAGDTWALARSMREAELAERAPRNPDSCVLYNRACAFFDVCTGAADINDPSRFERLDNVHPELAGAAG